METLQAQADAGVSFAIEALDKAPTEYNEFYWWAFSELASDRPIGMTLGAIPTTSIIAFCNEHRIYGYERYVFQFCMRGLDNEQLRRIRKKTSEGGK